MALFKKTKKKVESKTAGKDLAIASSKSRKDYSGMILNPRITEKGAVLADSSAYSFDVVKTATKTDIKEAIKAIYKVNPVKVAIINTPSTRVFMRGKKGIKHGTKKAYVFLSKGEKIEFA
jgi:large subunit ribosomal protein L23